MDRRALINHYKWETGASRFFNWLDTDGSATMRGKPAIVGSWVNWWQVGGCRGHCMPGECHDCTARTMCSYWCVLCQLWHVPYWQKDSIIQAWVVSPPLGMHVSWPVLVLGVNLLSSAV